MKKELVNVIEEREVFGKQFRIYGTIDSPLFLARDIAEMIDYQKMSGKNVRNTSKMLQSVDEDEKLKAIMGSNNMDTQVRHGGIRENTEMWFLTEDGLYEVLMQSRKPIAKAFKKEVKTILKQIRKTGGYIPVSQEDDEAIIMAKALQIMQNTLSKKDEIIAMQQPKVDYYEKVLVPDKLISTTDIAKDLGMSAQRLNRTLNEMKIIYKSSGCWKPYSEYEYLIPEYADYVINEHGQLLKWTELGREFIIDLLVTI